jgi:hypothetical protein
MVWTRITCSGQGPVAGSSKYLAATGVSVVLHWNLFPKRWLEKEQHAWGAEFLRGRE